MAKPKSKTLAAKTAAKEAPAKKAPVLDADPADVAQRVEKVLGLIAAIEAELGGLEELTEDARKYSNGRFREEESPNITTVLDTADAFPNLFVALAARDRGEDDDVFETGPTRDDLARRDQMARVEAALEPLAQRVGDTVLVLGARVREVSTPAYAIARVAASLHPKLRVMLAPATKSYAASAAKGQPVKKAKRTGA